MREKIPFYFLPESFQTRFQSILTKRILTYSSSCQGIMVRRRKQRTPLYVSPNKHRCIVCLGEQKKPGLCKTRFCPLCLDSASIQHNSPQILDFVCFQSKKRVLGSVKYIFQGCKKSGRAREGAEGKSSSAYPISVFSLLPNYKESAGILLFPLSCRAFKN